MRNKINNNRPTQYNKFDLLAGSVLIGAGLIVFVGVGALAYALIRYFV